MGKALKTITYGAAALSITAGSVFAKDEAQNIDRMDLNGDADSATMCVQYNGPRKVSQETQSIRQCFDYTKHNATAYSRYANYYGDDNHLGYSNQPLKGIAHKGDEKVAEFTCTGGEVLEDKWYKPAKFGPTICIMD